MTDNTPQDDAVAPDTAEEMTMGVQPIDALLLGLGLKNSDLVTAATGTGLTHKVVTKARKGRRLTARAQKKVLAALNAVLKTREQPPVPITSLFSYKGP